MYGKLVERLETWGWPSVVSISKNSNYAEFRKRVRDVTEFLDDSFPQREIMTMRLYCIVNDIREVPKCTCGNNVNVKPRTLTDDYARTQYDSYEFTSYCSRDCARSCPVAVSKRQNAIIERYGDHNMRTAKGLEEYREGVMKKYGVASPCKCPSVVDKMRRTNLERYGTEWTTQSNEMREKAERTLMERYGVTNPMKSEEIRKKARETNMDRYGTPNPMQNHIHPETLRLLEDEEYLLKMYDEYKLYTKISEVLGISVAATQRRFAAIGHKPVNHKGVSRGEMDIVNMVRAMEIGVEHGTRGVLPNRKELDIYIPSHNLAIEFNGVHWHSELYRDRAYHQQKSLQCKELGIQLIHVWEDDWDNKRDIVEAKIKAKLGLTEEREYARKTVVEVVPSKEARAFIDQNHIQGKTTASVWLGLRDGQGELVACMGMRKVDANWDLNRFATSKTVVGGFSKLLKHFKRNYEWEEIYTYAHLDYSHGVVYEKNGFVKSHITEPGMWYTGGGERLRRERFMKHKLPALFGDVDMRKTEAEIMRDHGYVRIYDAGSIKYVMKNPHK